MLFCVPDHTLHHGIESDPFIIAAVVLVVALDVVEEGFPRWVRAGGLAEMLFKCVVGELQGFLRALRPHVHIHAGVDWIPSAVDTSAPAVVPIPSGEVLQLEDHNFRNGIALTL